MGKFTDALQFWTKPLTRGVRAVTGNLDEEEQKRLRQEQENLFQTILKTTSPFRMGVNVLAQNYGPAIRGVIGGDPLERGKLEEWTAGALTPEEQDYLERKPYMAALKSSAGMTASLMPFATKGLATAGYVANPLLNKTLQYGLRGGVPGGLGGLSYSREGKELGDTLMGAGIGAGTSLAGGYIFDPEYRNLVNEGYRSAVSPGSKYQAAMGNLGEANYLNSLKERGLSGDDLLNAQDMAEEIVSHGGKINEDGTVTLYHATTKEGKNNILSSGKFISKEPDIFFSTSPRGEIQGYGPEIVEFNIPLEKLELDDIFDNEVHLKMKGSGVGDLTDVSNYLKKYRDLGIIK